jgi:hypothetical protein
MSRRCFFFKATDNRWYVTLGDFEYAYEDHECTTYGPFKDEEYADMYVRDYHSNPGGCDTDDSGVEPPPKNPTYPRRFF